VLIMTLDKSIGVTVAANLGRLLAIGFSGFFVDMEL